MENAPEQAATPKLKRGSWHEWAKQMREQGYTYAQIAEAVGVSTPAVYFAINAGKRWKGKKKGAETDAPAPRAPPSRVD
jgi:transposase-like protein